MAYHGYDPGDHINWYQSPQLGLFPTSPTGYSGGYYCLPSSHPHITQFPSHSSYLPLLSQFPFQPSYSPPPPPPSRTIINGFVFPYQFPSTHTHHSPDSNPIPWIYPSISQSHSYDPSVTSVNSHFVSTKTMPTSPVYHSAPSIPTFQSPSVSTFVPQHQFTDPKPRPLHSKPFRGCRCRVVMGAKARVSKKTRNPDLLRDVGKYSRSKRYHRRGLWVIKAKNSDIFPCHNAKETVAIMEELHQLLVGQTTPITEQEPGSSPLKFGSLPAGSVALTATNGSSSMLSASSRGILISEKPNFNLSPHEVILGLNKDFATALITGNHSEHTTTAVVTEELVLNVDKTIAEGVSGVTFSDIAVGEDDNEDKDDEWGNECMIFGSSAASKKFLKELQRESNTSSYSGAESYGDHSCSYNEDSQRVDGQIVTVEGNDDLMRNNKEGLLEKLRDMSWPENAKWVDNLTSDIEQEQPVDVHDGLTGELAFYTQALARMRMAFEKLQLMGLPFLRPEDYYAELAKSKSQLGKVKSQFLVEMTTNLTQSSLSQVSTTLNLNFQDVRRSFESFLSNVIYNLSSLTCKVGAEIWPPDDGEWLDLDGETYYRVVRGFLDNINVKELAPLIINAQKLESSTIVVDRSCCCGIVIACVGIEFSDKEHDILDEVNAQGGILGHVPKFKIFASHLGITTFSVSALQQFGHESLSQPILVEVYAAPEIDLHDIFLVPGTSYVLTLNGDPTIGVKVEFTILALLQIEYQNEYHIDPIDVKAVIAITIVQLYSKEAAQIYKKLNMMTRSAFEFETLEVILVECSAALDPWISVIVSRVLMFTTSGIKDVHASHLSCMRNINAPDQFVKAIRSTANGKAMMELNMRLFTDIGLHDFSLDSQSPTLGLELLFAKMKFRKVLSMKMYMVAKNMVASGATTQGHMLHDKVIEFSSQLNQANALGNYGHAEMKRLEQEINEKCVALAIIPMGNTDLVSEEIEHHLFLNVIFQVLDFYTYLDDNLDTFAYDLGDNSLAALHCIVTTVVEMLNTRVVGWLHLILCVLTYGELKCIDTVWTSKLKSDSLCKIAQNCSAEYLHPLAANCLVWNYQFLSFET